MIRAFVAMFGYVMKRRWLRRFLCLLVLLPVCGFLASNIFLNSRYVKGRIERKLEAKTGLVWEVGTVNWTPDGKVHVYDARAELGEGALILKQIDIEPRIREGLRGDLKFREVVVSRPRLEVGLEWLEEEMKRRVQVEDPRVVRPQPPVVAKVDGGGEPKEPKQAARESKPANGAGKGGVAVVPPTGVKPPKGGKPTGAGKPDVVAKPVGKKPSVIVKKPVVAEKVEELPSWLRVEDAVVVLKNGEDILFEVNGVDLDLPLGGEGLVGVVKFERMVVLGKELLEEREMAFERNDGELVFDGRGGKFMGLGYDFLMKVKLAGQDAYFTARGDVLTQDFVLGKNVEGVGFDLGLTNLRSEGVIEGRLMSPSSWRGGVVCMADRAHAAEHHREGMVDLERVRFVGELSRGVFIVPAFSAWSEDLAVMGNGYASLDGKVTGVTRLIGSPHVMDWFTGIKNGVHLFDTRRYHLVSQWDNPDRYYVDFRFDGPITQLEWKAEKVSDWEPFWPAMDRMKRFIKNEHLEDLDGVQRN